MTALKPDGPAIAVIGLAGRFPGADDVGSFWANLKAGRESITRFSEAELKLSGVAPEIFRANGYVAAKGALKEPDGFDACFFGYSAADASMIDPQHRLFLECAWLALEDAGYGEIMPDGRVGVFGSVGFNTYLALQLAADPSLMSGGDQFAMLIGNDKDFLANRTAQKLGLRGPAVTVQSACSSSLLAVHTACQSVLTGESDMAIAGGAAITFPVAGGYRWQDGGIHSRDGHCRSFDADASGFVPGNGAGVVVLKPLSDAQRDGDAIYAVILGSAANNDGGRSVGFTAPSIDGQAEVIKEALAFAGVEASDIGYVEAHGAATPVGDLIEVAALTRAFQDTGDGAGRCAIGSVKSNVGHLDAAAGVTGLIKTILALHHGLIPASVNFRRPNPKIGFEQTPFRVADRPVEWVRGTKPRIAAVNSLGIGGTNVHMVVSETLAPPPRHASATDRLVPLSARTPSALAATKARLADHLASHPDSDLSDVAFTLAVGRKSFEYRDFIVARERADAVSQLRRSDPVRTMGPRSTTERPLAFLFPGGGAQYPAMGRVLYRELPEFREHVDQCAVRLERQCKIDIRAHLYGSTEAGDTHRNDPAIALPCLFVTEYALAQTLIGWGIVPRALLGHSLGEYVAACLAGVMSLDSALRLVAHRGRLMTETEDGAMLSIGLDASRIRDLMSPDSALAAVNGRQSCVVSGRRRDIAELARKLDMMAIDHNQVAIAVAAHSSLVEPILDRFAAVLSTIELRPPRIPVISNVTGDWLTDEAAASPDYWVRHLRQTVRFADGLARLCADVDPILLEVGPGHTLSHLALLDDVRTASDVVTSMRSAREPETADVAQLFAAVGAVWGRGGAIDWVRFCGRQGGRRLHLPGYPFERERHNRLPIHDGLAREPPAPHAAAEMASATIPRESGEREVPPAAGLASIAARLQRIFAGLLGVAPGSIQTTRRFAEMGADSLVYVRASYAIQDEFGVAVPFRMMLGELATIEATAAWIKSREAAPSALEADGAHAQDQASPMAASSPSSEAAFGQAGERVPTSRARAPLSEAQRRRIQGICRRVRAMTPGSRAAAETSRPVLADNRSSAGFHPLWKDMVYPIIGRTGSNSRMTDIDGNAYVDVAMGFGVHLFGHAPPFIRDALSAQLNEGIQLGPQSPTAGEVARLICEMTGAERVVFANSGTEAVMTAMRLGRFATRRSRIVVFEGSYHGFYDGTLGRMPPNASRAIPAALGVTPGSVRDLVVLPYGEESSLTVISGLRDEIAAVIVEPVQSRRPDLQPRDFLHRLRTLTETTGAVLIFDEVITGFRLHPGGAQAHFEVKADLAVYGKVLGGGMPIGAVAGRRDIMDGIDGGAWHFGSDSYPKSDQTFFAGTFCKHPLAMAAAKAVLEHLRREGPALQAGLNLRTSELATTVERRLLAHGGYYRVAQFASLFRIVPTERNMFGDLLFFLLLERGVFTWEGRTCFLSTAHSDDDLQAIVAAIEVAAAEIELLHREGTVSPVHPTATAPANLAPGDAHPIMSRSRANVDEIVLPLTPGQRDIWAQVQGNEEASRAYNESMVLTLDGGLDVEALDRAIAFVVARHQSLRTAIAPSGRGQVVRPDAQIALPVVDFSGLADPDAAAAAWVRAEGARPFDLQSGPLLRTSLGRLSSRRHALVLTVHHLIGDGYSSGVLLREGGHAYSEIVSGREPILAEAAQYADYIARLDRRRSQFGAADLDYWSGVLRSPPAGLLLPTDFPPPKIRSYRGGRSEIRLDAARVATLREMSARIGTRFFSVMLAAYGLLLHHLGGTADLLIGIPSAGQIQHGLPDLVGYCLNVIPHRSILDRDMIIRDYIIRTDEMMAASYDHQLESPGDLLRGLKVPRPSGRTTLFETIFNLDKSPLPDCEFAGLSAVARENPSGGAKYDVIWNVTEDRDELIVDCVFNASLFRESTIEVWLAQFATLCALLTEVDRTISTLSAPLAKVHDDLRRLRALARKQKSVARLPSSNLGRTAEVMHDRK